MRASGSEKVVLFLLLTLGLAGLDQLVFSQAETELVDLRAKLDDLRKKAEGKESGLEPADKGQKIVVTKPNDKVLKGQVHDPGNLN